jgi:hypothetical protein
MSGFLRILAVAAALGVTLILHAAGGRLYKASA